MMSLVGGASRIRTVTAAATALFAIAACAPSTPEWSGQFRGLGQEPGWRVDIDSEGLHWLGDYGDVEFSTGPPEAHRPSEGVMIWTASADSHEIRVTAREELCRDVMSGHAFTHTVTVEVDGASYAGCGRWQEDAG